MDKDPLLARDWIKMTMKFPGFCLICKQRINSAEVGYWSRTAKSILHEDCYDLSGLHAKKNQDFVKQQNGSEPKKWGQPTRRLYHPTRKKGKVFHMR